MENTNQRKTPVFAEVHVSDEGQKANKNKLLGVKRLPYFKLTYPNGMLLTLPTDIGTEQLERFIRIKPGTCKMLNRDPKDGLPIPSNTSGQQNPKTSTASCRRCGRNNLSYKKSSIKANPCC